MQADAATGTREGADGGRSALASWSPWTRKAPISMAVLSVALLTLGWDRLLNIPVGPFNLKLPTVAFSAALVVWIVEWFVRRRRPSVEKPAATRSTRLLLAVLSLTLLAYVIASIASAHPIAALGQFMTVIAGAVIPCVATYLIVNTRDALLRALNALIIGGVIAMAFGVYQLVAHIAGWPQGIDYTALSGGLPRISSFLYESGYFGYYLILLLGAIVARSVLCGVRQNWWLLGATYVTLLLANTRAAFLTLPVFVVLCIVVFRKQLRLRSVLMVGGGLVVLWVAVALLPSVVPMTPTSSAGDTGAPAPATVSTEPPGSAQVKQLASIGDPNEASSNAPRLELISNAWKLYSQHPWLGLGPGNLFYYGRDAGMNIVGDSPNAAIVNNVYLQALVDGGPALLILQTALAVLFVITAYRRASPVTAALLCGWLAVALVAWIGTSYYWDLKLWAVAGLVLASARVLSKPNLAGDVVGKPSPAEDATSPG